jgi:hypothetical protein
VATSEVTSRHSGAAACSACGGASTEQVQFSACDPRCREHVAGPPVGDMARRAPNTPCSVVLSLVGANTSLLLTAGAVPALGRRTNMRPGLRTSGSTEPQFEGSRPGGTSRTSRHHAIALDRRQKGKQMKRRILGSAAVPAAAAATFVIPTGSAHALAAARGIPPALIESGGRRLDAGTRADDQAPCRGQRPRFACRACVAG